MGETEQNKDVKNNDYLAIKKIAKIHNQHDYVCITYAYALIE